MVKYLKGLDTLRALASLIVVWGHIELIKQQKGLPNLLGSNFYLPSGRLSVILFFVLSGFLITYLLVKNEELLLLHALNFNTLIDTDKQKTSLSLAF